nr:uncharacterized protein LOC111840984 [Paramormyrops kingsleyae]
MKLRNVKTEDTGEFRCEVHSDTDSANTTARIAALGYSSLHWLILGLCIAVTPVVLLTGALSVRHLIRGDKSKQALLSHGSHVTIPPIMVSTAFILWGVTEGSTEEAVTCPTVSLLYILVLFYMAPYRKLFTDTWRFIILLSLSTAFPIIIVGALTGSFIEFSAKDSPSPAEKATFGGMLGGIIFLIIVQTVHIVVWTKYSKDRENRGKILDYVVGITGIIFLVIVVSSISKSFYKFTHVLFACSPCVWTSSFHAGVSCTLIFLWVLSFMSNVYNCQKLKCICKLSWGSQTEFHNQPDGITLPKI